MNSMKIGTYQMDTTFGLYLPEYTIPAPAVQTNFVKIIGRDGSVDLSNALGLHYDSRTWSLDFKCFDPTVNWHTLSSQVMNAIHGKRLNFEFDDDPNYFWTGRVSVQNYVSNHGTGTLKVTIVSDPFKYAKLSTIVTKTASTGTDYTGALVTFNTANAKINDLSVTMQPIQDLHGYSNPWPAGGGKNIYPNSSISGSAEGVTITHNVDDESYKVSGLSEAYRGFLATSSFTLKAGTYTLSRTANSETVSANNLRMEIRSTDGLTVYASTGGTPTFTLAGDTEVKARIVVGQNGVDFGTGITYRFQIEAGSSPSAWQPYSNICPISGRTGVSVYVSPTQDQQDATTYAVGWTSEAGTVYGGTLDVVTGVLTVRYGITTFGQLNPNDTAVPNVFRFFISGKQSGKDNLLCSAFKVVNKESPANYEITGMYNSSNVYVKDTDYSTAADFKTAFSDQQIVYELATPITYQLTPQEIEALAGTNNVWSDGGNVAVAVVTPETLTNNGRAVVPTLTASADMVLKWGNYSASVQQGTFTIPQLILENGANLIYIIGTGSISFTWQEASL